MVHEQTMGNLIYVKHQSIFSFVFWGHSLASIFLGPIFIKKRFTTLLGVFWFLENIFQLGKSFWYAKKG